MEKDELKMWEIMGFSSEEILEWKIFSLLEAWEWKREKFTPKEALEWKNLNISLNLARQLRNEGIFPKDINQWIKTGFSLDLIAKFILEIGLRSPLKALEAFNKASKDLIEKFHSLQEVLSALEKDDKAAWEIFKKANNIL